MPDENSSRSFLIVGLGNPGPEYEKTPHNLGFMVIDRLAERHGIRVSRNEAKSLAGVGKINGCNVVLAKPQRFMNLSGPSVKQLLEVHLLSVPDLILVYDELALPWMQIRIRPKGSAGGHNGVKSVIGSLGTDEFSRLRLGIHPGHPMDASQFVLAPFRRVQFEELDLLLSQGAEAVESIIANGVVKSMTAYNRRAGGTEKIQE